MPVTFMDVNDYHTFCGCHTNVLFQTPPLIHFITSILFMISSTVVKGHMTTYRLLWVAQLLDRWQHVYIVSITARGQLYCWSQERLTIIPRKPSKQNLLNFYSRLTVNEQAWNLFLLWSFYKMVINYLCSMVEYFCSFSARERCWYFLSSALLSTLQALRFRGNQTEVCY